MAEDKYLATLASLITQSNDNEVCNRTYYDEMTDSLRIGKRDTGIKVYFDYVSSFSHPENDGELYHRDTHYILDASSIDNTLWSQYTLALEQESSRQFVSLVNKDDTVIPFILFISIHSNPYLSKDPYNDHSLLARLQWAVENFTIKEYIQIADLIMIIDLYLRRNMNTDAMHNLYLNIITSILGFMKSHGDNHAYYPVMIRIIIGSIIHLDASNHGLEPLTSESFWNGLNAIIDQDGNRTGHEPYEVVFENAKLGDYIDN
jgi:hypothetical protein